MKQFLKSVFKTRRIDVVPIDYTHYEPLQTYNIYWRKDEKDLYLWNGVGHYWQQMFYVDFEKYKEKLIEKQVNLEV